jgi:hypothetical protein
MAFWFYAGLLGAHRWKNHRKKDFIQFQNNADEVEEYSIL